MKLLISILILFSSFNCYSQGIIIKANNISIKNKIYGELQIINYPNRPVLIAGKQCDFPKNSAEDVFCNFFNVTNENDLHSFFEFDIPYSYSKSGFLENMSIYFKNPKHNFYELDSKFIFNNGTTKDIFIKYINHNEKFPKPLYSLFYLKEGDRGIRLTEMGENFELALFLTSIKSPVLYGLALDSLSKKNIDILNPYLSNKKELNIKKITEDFFTLIKEDKNHLLVKLLHDSKYSIFNMKDTTVTYIQNSGAYKSLPTLKYYNTYLDVFDAIKYENVYIEKSIISKKFGIDSALLNADSLAIKESIVISSGLGKVKILKFYNTTTLIFLDERLTNISLINERLIKILYALDLEAFMSFYSSKDMKKHSEINKLKPLVKDANGVLNIEKLAEVIKQNKASLSKYLDE